jgi:hypothetical protein
MEIKFGTLGKIIAGEEAGCYVKIVDDAVSTGGFLVLTSPNSDMSDGFDGWVENEVAL